MRASSADVLVAADLRGIESHGVARLESYYVDGARTRHDRMADMGLPLQAEDREALEMLAAIPHAFFDDELVWGADGASYRRCPGMTGLFWNRHRNAFTPPLKPRGASCGRTQHLSA